MWAQTFTRRPEPLTPAEKKEWLARFTGVCLAPTPSSLRDNIERARRSGVTAIVEPAARIRDAQVIETMRQIRHRDGLQRPAPVPPPDAARRLPGRCAACTAECAARRVFPAPFGPVTGVCGAIPGRRGSARRL